MILEAENNTIGHIKDILNICKNEKLEQDLDISKKKSDYTIEDVDRIERKVGS